jgi:hypothetical protein
MIPLIKGASEKSMTGDSELETRPMLMLRKTEGSAERSAPPFPTTADRQTAGGGHILGTFSAAAKWANN